METSARARLAQAYSSVDNMDAVVGAMAEDPQYVYCAESLQMGGVTVSLVCKYYRRCYG